MFLLRTKHFIPSTDTWTFITYCLGRGTASSNTWYCLAWWHAQGSVHTPCTQNQGSSVHSFPQSGQRHLRQCYVVFPSNDATHTVPNPHAVCAGPRLHWRDGIQHERVLQATLQTQYVFYSNLIVGLCTVRHFLLVPNFKQLWHLIQEVGAWTGSASLKTIPRNTN